MLQWENVVYKVFNIFFVYPCRIIMRTCFKKGSGSSNEDVEEVYLHQRYIFINYCILYLIESFREASSKVLLECFIWVAGMCHLLNPQIPSSVLHFWYLCIYLLYLFFMLYLLQMATETSDNQLSFIIVFSSFDHWKQPDQSQYQQPESARSNPWCTHRGQEGKSHLLHWFTVCVFGHLTVMCFGWTMSIHDVVHDMCDMLFKA